MRMTQAVLKAARDTVSWDVIRAVLIVGFPLAIFWVVIAYFLWDPVVLFTGKFIGWIPFSILKANGAFLVGGFVWFAAVLITYSVVVAFGNMLIFKHISQRRYSVFSILLLLFIALGWTVFAFLNWDFVYSEVSKLIKWFPFETVEKGVASMLAALIFYNLFIVSLSISVLVVRKMFLHNLQKRDYPDTTVLDKGIREKFLPVAFRDAGMFFILLVLFFPLLFVPFINILTQLLLWAWLIKESYFLGASSLYLEKNQIDKLKKHQFVLWGIATISTLFNLIPVINLFAPFFAMSTYFHWVMINKEDIA